MLRENRRRTFGVLVRAVDVVAAHDDGGELEALLVRVHEHLGGGLAGCVGVGRRQDAALQQVVVVVLGLAVNLVGRDVDEAPDAHLLGALEQHVGAVHVGMREAVRVAEAQVDVRLRGEVEDGVDVVPLEAVDDLGRVGDVPLVECEVAPVVEDAGVVEGRAVVQLVKRDDVVSVRIGEGEMADEPTCSDTESAALCREAGPWGTRSSYMKPAPPVIMMFLTSGRGSNLVVPMSTGASLQTP